MYDDIQTELAEKTQALKKMKQRVKVEKILKSVFRCRMIENGISQGLNAEINDIQSEFEKDRQDYLDSIR